MNIKIVLEGKLKEPCYKIGTNEYKKRLTGYINLQIIETANLDEYFKNNIKTNSFVITLEIEGTMLTSPEFAHKIKEIEQMGFYNEIVFLIGGSDGLSPEIKEKSNFKFSMSELTFLHQQALMILTEQIYRAFKILKNEPYHK